MLIIQCKNKATIINDGILLGFHVRTYIYCRYGDLITQYEEQDKSSDIEQQPPFGDRKISNIQPQNRGGGSKPTGTS